MQDIYITYSCNFMDATKISGFFTLMMGFENSDFSGNPHLSAKLTTLNNIYSLLNSSFFFPLIISANLYHHIMPKWNTCVLFCLHFHYLCYGLAESFNSSIYRIIVIRRPISAKPVFSIPNFSCICNDHLKLKFSENPLELLKNADFREDSNREDHYPRG